MLTTQSKIIEQGFEKPFMAFPPGATSGNLAKQDDAEITEADLTKLNEAKLQFGGADCTFTRMTGTYSVLLTQAPALIWQRTNSDRSGTLEPTGRVNSLLPSSAPRPSPRGSNLTRVVVVEDEEVDVDVAVEAVVEVVEDEGAEGAEGEVVMVETGIETRRGRLVCPLRSVLHR